ncbi:HTH-type transcriptional regulator HdfR [Serratia microhaemolytica]|uniref:HTH-type transcriptional regulator HdfR n=1 Tax=Serratia microhaemolytica TaxID=2675110 RepID=UPI000FDF1EF4|nr:HTH-type transcriptional regulator HdfR [Serratia microhaemolytica]
MDTELLKTFLEVSKTRHFGRAAESLYLTQSAVSFRIRQLENQLNANLFTRHRNNIRLTAAGEKLLPYAEDLINIWQQAKKEVVRSAQRNQLMIGAAASLWEAYLTPWLTKLYQHQPGLQLEARIAPRHALVKQLHERELDLLITTEPPKMDELESQRLGDFTLRLFASPHANSQLLLPYIKLEWGADFHQQERERLARDTQPILTTTSAHLTCQLLETTPGCAFLPAQWQASYPTLIMVNNTPPIVRPLYAVWRQHSEQQLLIAQLLQIPLSMDQ